MTLWSEKWGCYHDKRRCCEGLLRGYKWCTDVLQTTSPLREGKQSARPTLSDGAITGQQPGPTFVRARHLAQNLRCKAKNTAFRNLKATAQKVRKMSVDFRSKVWYCGVLRKEADKHGTKETAHEWKRKFVGAMEQTTSRAGK